MQSGLLLLLLIISLINPSKVLAGSISGFKFEDSDKDGKWENSEPKLGGWTIKLFTIDLNERPFDPSNPKLGPQIDEQLTSDANGEYLFQLSSGQYGVCEELKAGWMQTFPEKCHLAILSGDEEISGNNFGNFRLASILGVKWSDLDKDGIKSATESGIPDWRIFFDLNGNESYDSGEETVTTDAGGNYSFGSLSLGNYDVCEETRPGWDRIYPAESPCHHLTVATSGENMIADFGNKSKTQITACKYRDKNFNARLEQGEPPIAGIQISLYQRKTGRPYWQLEDSKITQSDGCVSFEGLLAGKYLITERLTRGYFPTYPVFPFHLISLAEGENKTVIFLNAFFEFKNH